MPDVDLVLRSTRVVTPDGIRAASVAVAGGRISAVLPHDAGPPYAPPYGPGSPSRSGTRGGDGPAAPGAPAAPPVHDLGDDALLPGLVDTHVHVNDPGRSAWEGFGSATRAAAAGGVTTLVDMPLNSIPPTTTVRALEVKRAVAGPSAHVDVAFWGGAVPGNLADLRPLHDAGVRGFKCFLLDSGVPEFPPLAPDQLEAALRTIAGFDGLLIVHAEDATVIDRAPRANGRRYADFLASRPREAENRAISTLIELARRLRARVHVLHLSSADALPLVAAAQRDGVAISAETCPHFLTLAAEEVPDGATEFKCCPPIRERANRDLLWQGLADGVVSSVVSDHSPCTADLKTPDFGRAWGGISSLQLGLPAVWTEARRRGHTLADVARWMSTAPAELAALPHKGAIEPGRDADFVVLAPERAFTVDPATLHHRNPVTAYAGKTLHGVVRSTWLRGRVIAEAGVPGAPTGRLVGAPAGRSVERQP